VLRRSLTPSQLTMYNNLHGQNILFRCLRSVTDILLIIVAHKHTSSISSQSSVYRLYVSFKRLEHQQRRPKHKVPPSFTQTRDAKDDELACPRFYSQKTIIHQNILGGRKHLPVISWTHSKGSATFLLMMEPEESS
jgi:hypothetical protein